MKPIEIPELALVVLIGASGSGKSTFASRHFLRTEVLSSDFFRGLVSDDENDQAATGDAFEALRYLAAKRLANARLTVVDATSVRPEDRRDFVALAKQYHCFAVAIVLNPPERICIERNRSRPDRDFGPHVVTRQVTNLRRNLRGLEREGFRHVYVLSSVEAIDNAQILRKPLWNNRKQEHGPFDIIGDLHGCADELEEMLAKLGYQQEPFASLPFWGDKAWVHPTRRKAVFLGDLTDRGPRSLDVIRIARNMAQAGSALCVPGNHDVKLMRALRGKQVTVAHGLEKTLAEFDALPESEQADGRRLVADWIDSLVSHFVLDDGKLVVAHAGLKQELQGRSSGGVREFALYGETTGETDEFGLPVRFNWASEYRGPSMVVYGHTPVPKAEWLNNTVNIDTGCVFGGALTALRYPEREFVQVVAKQEYARPARPFSEAPAALSAQQSHDDLLDLDDVIGKRLIETELISKITIREENAMAALEVMSRFAADPHWLIYLPPTMSPCETSQRPDLLEHPDEAFRHFQRLGISKVVCEEKHMGSRAVLVVCRDAETGLRRFGARDGRLGVCCTRTGRPFFPQDALEAELIAKVRDALTASESWDRFDTDWFCLDAELMPWSAKAQELLQRQYAAVGAAAEASLGSSVLALEQASARGIDVDTLLTTSRSRLDMALAYRAAYRRYCWPVHSLADLRLAPFHLLATEGRLHTDKDHVWHMDELGRIVAAGSPLLFQTRWREVDLSDDAQSQAATKWWEDLTAAGGEGMVVKPHSFIAHGPKGLVQPAVKCRGREYLRIIYGPEYTAPDQIDRLRARGLAAKRSLAIREFALGVESLRRFIAREPLRRVHECVFGVLALESEPADPRL